MASDTRMQGFVHDAFFYADDDGFLAGAVPFVREGLDAGEPVLVVVGPRKIERLREALGEPEGLGFEDMTLVGANPARIIPVWRDFVDHAGGGARVRGIGEPIWAEWAAAALAECHRHESLLNLAFSGEPASILCPYDTESLPEPVLEEAMRTHPHFRSGNGRRTSPSYPGLDAIAAPFADPLPPPLAGAREIAFAGESLGAVRAFVGLHADDAGLPKSRCDDLVLAANEIAANSVRHGGGGGVLLAWRDAETLLVEVRDDGRLDRPLAGRERPSEDGLSGRGLWIANQLCDLVQVRALPAGNAVRLHVRLG